MPTTSGSIDPTTSVNDVLRLYPAAVSVLNHCGIDTCCGGAAPLSTAASEARTDLDSLIQAIVATSTEVSR
jgi:iron-sulfur cluster repair protein YtfE (RIC family)